MKKLRTIIGLPVLEIGSGTQLGDVQDFNINIEQAIVIEVILNNMQLHIGTGVFSFQAVYSIGFSGIMIKSRDCIYEAITTMDSCFKLSQLLDIPVISETGTILGTLTDVLCNDKTGELRAYQISEGFITDFLHGRKVVPFPSVQVVNKTNIILPENTSRLLQYEDEINL